MEEKERGLILEFNSGWKYKDFALGLTVSSNSYNEFREYYLGIYLGFWHVYLGIRI